jgi:DNA-binding IclR family transcriptional regulator
MSLKNVTDKTTIHSVVKSLDVLELLARNPKGLQIKEISSEMKFNISSTYHIMNTLMETGYVQKVDNERFKLGYKIPYLHHAYTQSNVPAYNLSTVLRELHEETGETCYLGIESNHDIIIGEIIESVHTLRVGALYVGYKDHAHARATTKSILAFWPEAKIRHYFERRTPEKLTPSTVIDLDELIKILSKTKEQGYCLDEEEFVKGVCCIAAPVFDVGGTVVASFTVSLPAERYWSRREETIRMVRDAADRATNSLGAARRGSFE